MKNLADSFNKETKTHTAHFDGYGFVCSCGFRCMSKRISELHIEEETK